MAEADDGEIEELVELQIAEEARLEKLFEEQRNQRGLDDEVTLNTFFKLFDMWIQLYRLNKCMEVLEDVVPICRARGGDFLVQGVQALAFTLWKKSQFRKAAELFHEIEECRGPSAALCENLGHTYSSMGDFEQAAKYFQASLDCIDQQPGGDPKNQRGGVLLGFGIMEDRKGDYEKALSLVREAQKVFRQRADGKPSSLVAKAGMSVGKLLLKLAATEPDEAKRLEMEEEAVEIEKENVALFEVTCGDDSPLTASALKGLGESLARRQRLEEARDAFARSYSLEAQKDAFDLLAVMEVHNLLFGVHMTMVRAGSPLDRQAFRGYKPTVATALQRVRALKQDANAGAYYKVAGELLAFAEDYSAASALLEEAIELFATEEEDKVKSLISNCLDLKAFCDRQNGAAVQVEPNEPNEAK